MDFSGTAQNVAVLVVEDDPAIGRAVTRALGREGYPVLLARRFSSALQLDRAFEVAVLDLDLPDGSGVELGKQLLAAGRARSIVFYSASRDAVQLARAGQLGEVVAKDAGLAELLGAVTRAHIGPVSSLRVRDGRAASLGRR